MNRLKFTLTTLMRSSPLHGEDGRVAPRSVTVLVVVLAWWASARRLKRKSPSFHSRQHRATRPPSL